MHQLAVQTKRLNGHFRSLWSCLNFDSQIVCFDSRGRDRQGGRVAGGAKAKAGVAFREKNQKRKSTCAEGFIPLAGLIKSYKAAALNNIVFIYWYLKYLSSLDIVIFLRKTLFLTDFCYESYNIILYYSNEIESIIVSL